jgi:hypothetical protein
MMMRNLALGLVLAAAASLAGCKHCWGPRECDRPIIGPPGPCNNCGQPGGPGVVAPPPGGGGFVPGNPTPGPYGASYGRKI